MRGNCILGKINPRVGVLSNGEEESKGTKLTREANALLKDTSLNYIGYVEGKDIFKGGVDIVVCDGFVGNILLKVTEGIAESVITALKNEIQKSISSQVGFALAKKSFYRHRVTEIIFFILSLDFLAICRKIPVYRHQGPLSLKEE